MSCESQICQAITVQFGGLGLKDAACMYLAQSGEEQLCGGYSQYRVVKMAIFIHIPVLRMSLLLCCKNVNSIGFALGGCMAGLHMGNKPL